MRLGTWRQRRLGLGDDLRYVAVNRCACDLLGYEREELLSLSARDVAPEIRVNILAPGFIETAFGQEADPKFRQQVIETTPLRRWGTPEDVAAAAVFLASDDAAFLTGQMIAVNGGVVM